MKRPAWLSPMLIAVALTPSLLEAVSCERGDTYLLDLQLVDELGVDVIEGFNINNRLYSATLDGGTATLIVETRMSDSTATYQWIVDGNSIEAGSIGVGGGTVALAVPAGSSELYVGVRAAEGNVDGYTVNVEATVPCGNGTVELPEECDDGNNVDGDGCAANCEVEPIQNTVPMACSTNVTSEIFERDPTLRVDPLGPVIPNAPATVTLGGEAVIPEFWLDAAQGVTVGGIQEIAFETLSYEVVVRSGATGNNAILTRGQPYAAGECRLFDAPCNTDSDCVEACRELVSIPIIDGVGDACAECNSLGKALDCANNGFCVGGDLRIPLEEVQATYVPTEPTAILFGWKEQMVSSPPTNPTHYWVAARALNVISECTMGTANATQTDWIPLPDEDLIALPVLDLSPTAVCGDFAVTAPEECDDGNVADGDGCASDCTREPSTKTIPVVCTNNVVPAFYPADYELTVDPQERIAPNADFDVDLQGVAVIDDFWLDAVQGASVGGTTEMQFGALNLTVAARSGATGSNVLLTRSQPYAVGSCSLAGWSCTTDGDCLPGDTCMETLTIPTVDGSDACATCNAFSPERANQCALNGFCVAGDLSIPLEPATATFTAASSGDVALGWLEDLALPSPPAYGSPAGPNGVRWTSAGIVVAFECSMGRDNATQSGGLPLADAELILLPIVGNCGNGVTEADEVCDDFANDGGDGECIGCYRIQTCGDAITEGTEECDDGINDGTGPAGCLPGCLSPP